MPRFSVARLDVLFDIAHNVNPMATSATSAILTGEYFCSRALLGARDRRGLTQSALAEARDSAQSAVSRFERVSDRSYRDERAVESIADALSISPIELLLEEVAEVRPDRREDIAKAIAAAAKEREAGRIERRIFSLVVRRARLNRKKTTVEFAPLCHWDTHSGVVAAESSGTKNERVLERVAHGLGTTVPDLLIEAFVDWGEPAPTHNPRARLVTYQGRTQTIGEWAKLFGVKRQALQQRLKGKKGASEAPSVDAAFEGLAKKTA